MEAMASLLDMNDDDLRVQIVRLEEHIERLSGIIERCRKIIVIAKAAIATGGVLLSAMILGAIRVDPMVMIGAIVAQSVSGPTRVQWSKHKPLWTPLRRREPS